MKLTLKKPVTVGSVTVTELVMREEVVSGDLRGLRVRAIGPDMKMEELLTLAGRLCAQPDPVMNALSLEDTLEVAERVVDLFPGGPTTGQTGSPS